MDIKRVKFCLGRNVDYNGIKYRLTAVIMRQAKNGFHFQAELEDQTARSSVVIADLKDVNE